MSSSTANTAPALERDASRGRTGFFIPAVLLVVAAVLRFLQLGAESFWFDEIIMANLTRQPTAPLLEQLFATARAPLYPLLGHFWLQIFDSRGFPQRVRSRPTDPRLARLATGG